MTDPLEFASTSTAACAADDVPECHFALQETLLPETTLIRSPSILVLQKPRSCSFPWSLFNTTKLKLTSNSVTSIDQCLVRCSIYRCPLTVLTATSLKSNQSLRNNLLLLLLSTLTTSSLILMNADAWPKTPMNTSSNNFNSLVMNPSVPHPTKSSLTSTTLAKNLSGLFSLICMLLTVTPSLAGRLMHKRTWSSAIQLHWCRRCSSWFHSCLRFF